MTNLSRSPESEDRYPCWFPDGRRVAFTTIRGGNTKLWVMRAVEPVPRLRPSSVPMRITVYCASSAAAHPGYAAAAHELGTRIARAGATLVYGGGAIGSMGRLADGALAAGGRVVGVMPRFMGELEWAHPGLVEVVWTDTMAERKERLIADSEAVVALPGGTGTLEELLEVLTLKRLGLFLKPVVIVNQRGFYDPLVRLLKDCVDEAFMAPRHLDMWREVGKVEEVLPAIAASPAWSKDARGFAVQHASPVPTP